jgi:hypothetical protein
METISDLLPALHSLRSEIISGDKLLEEEIEVERILCEFGRLESVFEGFEDLILVQQIKQQLLELVSLQVSFLRKCHS